MLRGVGQDRSEEHGAAAQKSGSNTRSPSLEHGKGLMVPEVDF
jgi:hypothetical protein